MRREAESFRYYLAILEPENILTFQGLLPSFKRQADEIMEDGGTYDDALDSIRKEVEKVYALNRTNETFPDPPKRRGTEGLGYVSSVLQGRNLAPRSDWNQAYHYIGEAFTHAVKIYETQTGDRNQCILTPS